MPFFISGDWPFFFASEIAALPWTPVAYAAVRGIGENVVSRLWIDYPFHVLTKLLFTLGLPWAVVEKLWFLGIVLLCFFGAKRFTSKFLKLPWQAWVGGLLYVCNTYFLLVLGGGQLGVALAYAIFPWAFSAFVDVFAPGSWRKSAVLGIWMGLLVASDLRLGYLGILAFGLYGIFHLAEMRRSIFYLLAAVGIALLVNMYWILPILQYGMGVYPASATGESSLPFFSVADFSHAMTLLHPNWPENLFGRVYFQKPEFILVPIAAFASLLAPQVFTRFFAALALVGIFLAKGVNEPAGVVYQWLFGHIPGFVMFRDPTKFYLLISLAYAILIPSFLGTLAKRKAHIGIFIACVLLGGMGLDIFRGKTSHSFQFATLPSEYQSVHDMLAKDTKFSRVLWVPGTSHFSTESELHPAIDANLAFGTSSPSGILAALASPSSTYISDNIVGYIIVPIDERKNMFLNDYVYDESMRDSFISSMSAVFARNGGFQTLAVYQTGISQDLFSSDRGPVQWAEKGTNYFEIVAPLGATSVTMNLAFDAGWRLQTRRGSLSAQKTQTGLMKFPVAGDGVSMHISFAPDDASRIGLIIGLATLTMCMVGLLRRRA